jgi:DNA-binding NarL/FixJ family response regulator
MTGATSGAPRVFIVDDHPAVSMGLRLLLEQEGISVCGEARDTAGALAQIEASPADLVMVDLSLGDEDGVILVERLAERAPTVPLLVYSMHETASEISRAFAAGARGYVTKREAPGLIARAVRECLAGRTFVSPRAARSLDERPGVSESAEPLSLQEQRVYDLLGQAASVQEIAEKLEVSRRTVETYFGRIQVKLRLADMRELRRHAVAHHR